MASLSHRRPFASRAWALAIVGLAGALASAALLAQGRPGIAADPDDARIGVYEPRTLDPAAEGDSSSAAISIQLYETVTAFDQTLTLRPALAAGWDVSADGRRVVFHVRPGLAFSDGTPLTAADVVGSWLRLLDPRSPSPLVELALDIAGARAYVTGAAADPASVGLRAEGDDVVVDLERPGSDFPAIVAAPIFGVVPASVWRDGQASFGAGAVTSGGFTVEEVTDSGLTLRANPRYWAGEPAIGTLHLLFDFDGRNPITAFQDGDVDLTEVAPVDAPWLPYDEELGPQLRETIDLAVTYLGFDTSEPPFDDARVRQAVGAAVDWQRIVELAGFTGDVAADSIVPPGIPGGGDANWLPRHDPAQARDLLAQAGHPGGAGLAELHFAAGFTPYAGGIVADLERELGLKVEIEALADHYERLSEDPPELWIAGWSADYPGANDFLGVILGSGVGDNYGRWSAPAFDAAIADALATRDAAAAQAAFERALAEVQREVPVVPLSYGRTLFLSRDGLLGAGQNGLGFLRMAGLAWAP